MPRLSAVVAATAGTGTAQSESRAVSLHMAKALAVIALLRLGSARKRASVGLVAFESQNTRYENALSTPMLTRLLACSFIVSFGCI